MEIEKQKSVSYLITFSRKNDRQRTSVVNVDDEKEIESLIRNTFVGRFKKPDALTCKDGVNIVVHKFDHIKMLQKKIMNTRIYNKSVRQARIEVEKAIRIGNINK